MNAHTPAHAFVTEAQSRCNPDGAKIALALINNLAEALVMCGDSIVNEGDGRIGNVVATLAAQIQKVVVEAETAVGFPPQPES